jgi:hypothetical protein
MIMDLTFETTGKLIPKSTFPYKRKEKRNDARRENLAS